VITNRNTSHNIPHIQRSPLIDPPSLFLLHRNRPNNLASADYDVTQVRAYLPNANFTWRREMSDIYMSALILDVCLKQKILMIVYIKPSFL